MKINVHPRHTKKEGEKQGLKDSKAKTGNMRTFWEGVNLKRIRTISYILLESFRLPHCSEAPFILNTSGSWNNYVSESLGVPIFT